ncbi:tRNA-binding protein [Sporosarcina luteola]|nr:tRNA-binding protein [Sporosarcina luteola]
MNAFYNPEGVGNVLLVQFIASKPNSIEATTLNDVTYLKDAETGELAGLNLFNASEYVDITANGQVEVTEKLVAELREALKKNDVAIEFNVDFSPKFVVGHVVTKEKHPNADKLSVCTVDVGNDTLQIVCGAPNVEAGQKVVVAKVGAVMPSGMVIRDAELRGIPSSGMICSAKELSLPNAPEAKGILVLSETAIPGEPFTNI